MTPARPEDASFDAVLSAAQAGAAWAQGRLWETYAGRVAGYLRVHGAPDPDDSTSEVFIGAFRTLRAFRGDEAAFRSWLFTIAHRRLVDARRAAARRPNQVPIPDGAPDPRNAPEDEILRQMATERVRALCERLVPDQRDVLLLRLVGGLTVAEVGAACSKSPGAVKALQRRGLLALQKILEREGVPL